MVLNADKEIVNKYKPEEVIDGLVETLVVAQKLLEVSNQDTSAAIAFKAGCAIQEISHANGVLRAFRDKHYGQKSTTVL